MPPPRLLVAAYDAGGRGAVAERARLDASALTDAGAEVSLVTDRWAGGRVPAPVSAAGGRGPRGVLPRLPGPGRELAAVGRVGRGLSRAARPHVDAVVFHESTIGWTALPVARKRGAQAVFVVHALLRDRLDSGANPYGRSATVMYARANAQALRRSDRVVCVSEHLARVAVRDGASPDRVTVLANPVDLTRFSAGDTAARDIDVLFVGRLSVEKGVDVLLDAVPTLPAGTSVVIAGDGPERSALERHTAAAGVRFVGWVDRDALPALLRRARVLAMPSRSEPQGMVALEAMASGATVVASAVGGLAAAIVDGSSGWLVPPDDPQTLARAIEGALADEETRVRVAAAARLAAETHSAAGFGGRLLDAYLG